MGYLHIDNLYRDVTILEFKHLYALEKIHGTSAHIRWNQSGKQQLTFFSGGEKSERFISIFNKVILEEKFIAMSQPDVIIYGEAYGGKMQGMKDTYGEQNKFIAFDIKIGNFWLSVPQAEQVASDLGVEFVSYELIESAMEAIDAQRDADSVQAIRNGMGSGHKREGIVLRPPFEVTLNGSRMIIKHKRDDFRETKEKRTVGVAPEVLTEAKAIAEEWVTPMRFAHVIDKLQEATDMSHTPIVLAAMLEDVLREGAGEFEVTKEAKKAIGQATLILWKAHVSRIPK